MSKHKTIHQALTSRIKNAFEPFMPYWTHNSISSSHKFSYHVANTAKHDFFVVMFRLILRITHNHWYLPIVIERTIRFTSSNCKGKLLIIVICVYRQ